VKRAISLAATLMLAACRAAAPGDIPKIVFGRDACAHCGMIVSEARFASGYVDASGKSVIFDDVGELVAEAAEDPAISKAAFVPDAEDAELVRAESAFFVRIPSVATPMGTGVSAFKDRARAEAFSRSRGGDGVLGWAAAREMAKRQPEVPRVARGADEQAASRPAHEPAALEK
jgi:copper chaperone NosL